MYPALISQREYVARLWELGLKFAFQGVVPRIQNSTVAVIFGHPCIRKHMRKHEKTHQIQDPRSKTKSASQFWPVLASFGQSASSWIPWISWISLTCFGIGSRGSLLCLQRLTSNRYSGILAILYALTEEIGPKLRTKLKQKKSEKKGTTSVIPIRSMTEVVPKSFMCETSKKGGKKRNDFGHPTRGLTEIVPNEFHTRCA